MADVSPEQAMTETRREAESVAGEASYWGTQIALSDKDHEDFLKDGRDIVKLYKNDERISRSGSWARNAKRFNILYSNTEVLKAALFARMAKPDIRRRFADADPAGRKAAEVVERSTIYIDDVYDAEDEFEAAIQDYLLPGRGVVRVCYEADVTKDDSGTEYVAGQQCYYRHVNWQDFRHDPANQWTKVQWIAYRHLMNRDALRKNNFRNPEKIPLNWSPTPDKQKVPDGYKRAEVWEIWDKQKRQRIWIVKGYKETLRKDDDPYGLEDFFDIAPPLLAVQASDTVIPRAEYQIYRDQAEALDDIENRIDRLTRALKRRGVYDASIPELKKLAKAGDNEFLPIKNYAELQAKGGVAGAFQQEDIRIMAAVLTELHRQRDLRLQTIYEVIGIADIMRGATDPRETYGAQRLKSQFGGNRLRKRQNYVQKWIRNTLRLAAEIVAEHFEPEKLAEMTGFRWQPMMPAPPLLGLPPLPGGAMAAAAAPPPGASPMPAMPGTPAPVSPPLPGAGPPGMGAPPPPVAAGGAPLAPAPPEGVITPEIMDILRNDKLRSYRIDVETDSTVFEDAESEKQARTELLQAISQFVTAWMPILQAQPVLTSLAFEMLSFGVRGFKAGRQLEDALDQAKQQLEAAAKASAGQPQQPDPKMTAALAQGAVAQTKAQADIAKTNAKLQADLQKTQADLAIMRGKFELAMRQLGIKHEELQLKQITALSEPAGNA